MGRREDLSYFEGQGEDTEGGLRGCWTPEHSGLWEGIGQMNICCISSHPGLRDPTPVLLPGKSHGQRSLVGCSPRVSKSGTRLSNFTFTFHFHALDKEMATHSSVLTLGNPRDGGAWWASVYGVTQSWTRLKRLSSSSRAQRDWGPGIGGCLPNIQGSEWVPGIGSRLPDIWVSERPGLGA